MHEIYSTRNSTFQAYLFHYSANEVCGHLKVTHDQLVLLGCLVTYKNNFHNRSPSTRSYASSFKYNDVVQTKYQPFSWNFVCNTSNFIGFKLRFQLVRVIFFFFFFFFSTLRESISNEL